MKFKILIDKKAIEEIKNGVTFYNSKRHLQGEKFKKQLESHISTLKTNPYFRIRYKNIRCLPMQKYPYMIHFRIMEESKTIKITAVLHTKKNPKF